METSNVESNQWLYVQRLNMDANIISGEHSVCQKLRRCFEHNVRPHLSRKLFAVLISSQIASLLLCAFGVASQKLVIACGVKIPAFQAFLMYMLLATIFTSKVAYNSKETMDMIKERWWKYIIIAVIDVEANFAVFKAYQYTSLTSVQLLDCLSIPVVVILSIFMLKARNKAVHFFGVFICLSGMGFLVWADVNGSRGQGPKSGNHYYQLFGDALVIAGAVGYGASNIAEEFVVKTSTITEFLGMMTFFASFISGANVVIFEREALSSIDWNYEIMLFLALSVISMFTFYVLLPLLIMHSSATLVNLALLTADLYSLFAGLYFFNYVFSELYIVSFVIIIVGVVIFKVFPTTSRIDQCEGEAIVNESESESLLDPEPGI